MPEFTWDVGTVTGIIGSVTGIGGLLVAIQANRKVGQIKAMDLRIELGKSIHEAENDVAMLRLLIKEADISRKAVDRLKGDFHPKSTDEWNRNIRTYEQFAEVWRAGFLKQLEAMPKMSVSELEKAIIDTAMSKTNAESIEKILVNAKNRYEDELKDSKN